MATVIYYKTNVFIRNGVAIDKKVKKKTKQKSAKTLQTKKKHNTSVHQVFRGRISKAAFWFFIYDFISLTVVNEFPSIKQHQTTVKTKLSAQKTFHLSQINQAAALKLSCQSKINNHKQWQDYSWILNLVTELLIQLSYFHNLCLNFSDSNFFQNNWSQEILFFVL